MATFTELYTTLLGFVNFRLYQTLNLVYPPKVSRTTCVNLLLLNALLLLLGKVQIHSNWKLNLFILFWCMLAWWTRRVKPQIRVWRRLCLGIRKLFWGTNSCSLFISTINCAKYYSVFIDLHLHISFQKLSALSASLARTVPSVEEEEAELDHFPAEGVSKRQLSILWTSTVTYSDTNCLCLLQRITYWETFCS